MAATYAMTPPAFPSGIASLDQLASFAGAHFNDPGAGMRNLYGRCDVLYACQEFVDAAEEERDFDPFKSGEPEYLCIVLTVSMERRWVMASLAKAEADVRERLLRRRMDEGPVCDDDVPDWFDSIGFGSKVRLSSATACSATLTLYWREA